MALSKVKTVNNYPDYRITDIEQSYPEHGDARIRVSPNYRSGHREPSQDEIYFEIYGERNIDLVFSRQEAREIIEALIEVGIYMDEKEAEHGSRK